MNKKNNPQIAETVEEMPLANPQGKTVEEMKEVVTVLENQVKHHQTMMIKAQGGLEVMLQLIPKEEVGEMLAQKTKSNGEAVNDG